MSKIVQIKTVTSKEVDALAKNLLDKIDYIDGPVNVDKLLEYLDIKRIEKQECADNCIASLEICEFHKKKYNNSKVIFVDDNYYKETQNFYIAELIAEYIYNYNNQLSFTSTKGYYEEKNLLSRVSNYFALSLLMPLDVFKEKYEEIKDCSSTTSDIAYSLSAYFRVPYMKVEEKLSCFLKQEEKQKQLEYKKI